MSAELSDMKALWNRYNETGDYDSLIIATRPFYEKSLAAGDSAAVLYSGVFIAQAYLFSDRIDSARTLLDSVLPYMECTDSPQIRIVVSNVLGVISLKTDLDYPAAMRYYLEGLESAEAINDVSNSIILLSNIVKIFYIRSDGTARIEVSLGAKEEGNYRLVAAIVEDNVVAYQNGHGAGYNHTNVLRYISDRRVLGPRNIGMSAGEEVSQAYSFTIDESICNADNLAAVVYSLRYENGVLVADNAVKVALGDSIDYRYDD